MQRSEKYIVRYIQQKDEVRTIDDNGAGDRLHVGEHYIRRGNLPSSRHLSLPHYNKQQSQLKEGKRYRVARGE